MSYQTDKMKKAFSQTALFIIASVFAISILIVVLDMISNGMGNLLPATWTRTFGNRIDILQMYFGSAAGPKNHLISLVNFIVYVFGLSTLAALLSLVKIQALPGIFHSGRLLFILVVAIKAAIDPTSVEMKGVKITTTESIYLATKLTTVTESQFVHQTPKLFSWSIQPRFAAPLCRLDTDTGMGSSVQIWKGLWKGKRAGIIFANKYNSNGQRIACEVSPFESAQFACALRNNFVSNGAIMTGKDKYLNYPVEIWELSVDRTDVLLYVASEAEFPWILKKIIKHDGLTVAVSEITAFLPNVAIPLSAFLVPGHIEVSRNVEVINVTPDTPNIKGLR